MKKISVANGKYIKDGVEKTRWVNIGVIGTSQNGKEYCLLDPTINLAGFTREPGKDMLMCSIFEDVQQGQQAHQTQQSQYAQPQNPPQQQYQAPQQHNNPPQTETYYDAQGNPIPV